MHASYEDLLQGRTDNHDLPCLCGFNWNSGVVQAGHIGWMVDVHILVIGIAAALRPSSRSSRQDNIGECVTWL